MDAHLTRPHATLAYSVRGPESGRAVVVAHSLATSRQWEDEAGILDWTAVADRGHRLVRFDTRGHGESTGEPNAAEYEWPALAGDLLAVADTVSPDAPVDAIGESTGCGVLLWAATTHPERFRRLVLAIPPTRGVARVHQSELYRAAAEMIELRGVDAWRRIVNTAPPAPVLRAGGWGRSSRVAVADDLIPSVLRGAAASILPDDALGALRRPVLILTWEDDANHPVETAEYLAERLPDARLEIAAEPDTIRAWGARAAEFLTAE